MNKLIDLNTLETETLTEMANDAAALVEKNAKATVIHALMSGRSLAEIKSRTPHGEWMAWLKTNFNYSSETARQYIELASNSKRAWNLEQATSIRHALRIIAEEKAADDPPTERIPNRVTVVESTSEVGQPSVQADDDPPPNPPTNRKVSAVSKKVSESTKTPTAVITPEIVTDTAPAGDPIREWIKSHTVADLLSMMVDGTDEASKKTTAKQLRKLADKLDPPSVGAPSIEAVEAWATENGLPDFDVEKFYNHYELAAWKYGKAKTPIKDWKRAALNAYASGKGWAVDGANRLPF
jgi:hypothetical protein